MVTGTPYGNVAFADCGGLHPGAWSLIAIPRNPSPADGCPPVKIGDVGLICEGRFELLFSAGSPLGERQPGVDIPDGFKELCVGTPVTHTPWRAGCLRSKTILKLGKPSDTEKFTTLCAPPVKQSSHRFKRFPYRLPGNGADFEFDLKGKCGAALVTRHLTRPEDTDPTSEPDLQTYIKAHYKSWVTFAKRKEYKKDIYPVLVSGFDMTRDFSMVAYSKEKEASESDPVNPTKMFTPDTPPTFEGKWRASFAFGINQGPKQPSVSSSGAGSTEDYFYRSNQCVFIRYYTMRENKATQVGTSGAGAGPSVVQNPEHVRLLQSLSIFPLNLASRRTTTAGMPLRNTYSR